jgi:hypothetical protein
MLAEFLQTHRADLIARTRAKAASRSAPRPTENEPECGVPLFLDQLTDMLRSPRSGTEAISRSGLQGRAPLRTGFTVAQVVRGYGDVCQAVTELAVEVDAPITVEEFRALNLCLDDAITEAVTDYATQRERSIEDAGVHRLGTVVHEVRGGLSTAMMAFALLESGNVGMAGSTGAVLKRSLQRMCTLLDHSFADVRLTAGGRHIEPVLVSKLVEEMELDGSIQANARGLALTCEPGEYGLRVRIDRQLVMAALANLLHNAFKFSRPDGHVWLRTSATADYVRFEVEDQCGGLPPGKAEELFAPFEQRGIDRSGLGLGLDIARRSVEACQGRLKVRDVPGSGCVFAMDLPREHGQGGG